MVCIFIAVIFSLYPAGCTSDLTTTETKGTCGAPGYSYTSDECIIYLTWLCASPCTPTVPSQVIYATSTNQHTETVYCENPDYNTSSGIYFWYHCP